MNCDKCKTEVTFDNDATFVGANYENNGMVILAFGARHFLPVYKDGKLVCEGSPSRAQYIEGQPRDKRGYEYVKENEQKWRDAYAKTLTDFAATQQV